MWYAVAARPGAELRVGFRKSVAREQFRRAWADGTHEEMFARRSVCAGDVFFVRAGTPHTIGPGVVLCEVQEYSDLTYRLYDYNRVNSKGRARELHVEKALAAMNFGATRAGKVEPVKQERGPLKEAY